MTEIPWWRPGAHGFPSKTLDARMLEEVGPAVQYVLLNDAAAWGAVTKGAEAWALLRVTGKLERIIGLVLTGVLGTVTAAVDGLSDDARAKAAEENEALQAEWVEEQGPKGLAFAEIDALTFADVWIQSVAWPWDRDEGETLCRASMLVIDAAERIAPGWDGLAKWQKHLAEHAGTEAWKCDNEEPSVALEILVSAAAWEWKRETRFPAVLRGFVGALAAGSDVDAKWKDGQLRVPIDGGAGGVGELVAGVLGPSGWLGRIEAGGLAGVLGAWLINEATRQWQTGILKPENVLLPAGRDERAKVTGVHAERSDVDKAFEWLCGVKVDGWSLVDGFEMTTEKTGGLNKTFYRVKLGEGLWAWHGVEFYRDRGLTLPSRLQWLSPVLPLNHVPHIGYHPTRNKIRVAVTLGFGAVFIDHRDQCLNWGGIEPETLAKGLEKLFGLYRRQQASLAADLIGACLKVPELTLPGLELPSGAVLERFRRNGKELLRLGPSLHGAWRLVIGAAERTQGARIGAAMTNEKKAAKKAAKTLQRLGKTKGA